MDKSDPAFSSFLIVNIKLLLLSYVPMCGSTHVYVCANLCSLGCWSLPSFLFFFFFPLGFCWVSWSAGFQRLSCLYWPSLCRSPEITDVCCCTWPCMGSRDSNFGSQACTANAISSVVIFQSWVTETWHFLGVYICPCIAFIFEMYLSVTIILTHGVRSWNSYLS